MSRKCSICTHPKRRDIDKLILAPGVSLRQVAEAFPGVHEDALKRHKNRHLLPTLEKVEGLTETDIKETTGLLGQMDDLRERAMSLLDQAESSGNLRTAIAAVKEARGVLDSLARITGEGTRSGTVVNIINAPTWINLRSTIAEALQPFPEARSAVVAALEHVQDVG